MVHRDDSKKALIRFATGVVFLSAYAFMAANINIFINQAIIWATGAAFLWSGVLEYRELKALKPIDSNIHKRSLPDALKTPVIAVILVAAYYALTPDVALIFYVLAGFWLIFTGFFRSVGIILAGVKGMTGARVGLIQTAVVAVVLIVIDVGMLGSFYIAGALLLIMAPFNLFKAFRQSGNKSAFGQKLMSAAIYVTAAVIIIAAFTMNNTMARRRAEVIAAACEQYKSKYGEYPPELSRLAPEFMREIPAAKIGFFESGFKYISGKESHVIMYVKIPPYGRAVYTLETGKWGYID